MHRDERNAAVAFRSDEHAAITTFETAQFGWEQAAHDYDHALKSATTTLQSAANDAIGAYEKKVNKDSARHSSNLYFQMKTAVAGAVQAYEVSAGAAAATLAAAAGIMLTAYVTFTTAITAAESKHLLAEANANETYWQSIEGLRG